MSYAPSYATDEEVLVTRTDSVRHAATTTKDSVRHAAEVVAPYADSAKDRAARYAAQYAQETRKLLAPKVTAAADQARETAAAQYDAYLAPRLAQARSAVPPKVAASTAAAAQHTRRTARRAARYAAPRVEHAVGSALAASEPVREEAAARAAAAFAALRGQVPAAEVEKLVRRYQRRGRAGRIAKRVLVAGAVAGAGVAVWRWWTRQTNPEWLVEAPSATEPAEDERMTPGSVASPGRTTVDETPDDGLDPEVRAKQAEDEARRRRGDSHG